MRHSDSSPPIPPRFVAFARRYPPSTCDSLRRTPGATSTASGLVSRCPRPGGLYDGDDEASRGPGKPTRTHATRSDPGEVAASTASETRRDDLPSNARRRPSHSMHFGAQLRGLRAPCERFAPWVTPGPRITRFRLAADLGRMGLDTHRVSNKVSKITSRHLVPLDRAFPAHALVRRAERALATRPRRRPARVKDRIVRERGFTKITTVGEAVVDFDYQPTKCTRPYRVVALKKNLSIEKGEHVLFDDIRYFFYITNDATLSCAEVVQEARQRCDQENLIAQLKGGVRALHAPVNTLHANWAYMVMASLAWSLKAWVALTLPIAPRWRARHAEEQRRLLRMDFRTFLGAFINVPCQILTSGRRVIFRLLAWNPWQYLFFRFVDAT